MAARCTALWSGTTALLLLVSNAAVTRAEPIRYEYGGTITSADPSTGIAPGTRFTGSFTYDPQESRALGLMIEQHNQYDYRNVPSNPSELTLTIGDRPVFHDEGRLQLAVTNIEYSGQAGYPSPPMSQFSVFEPDGNPDVALNFANNGRSVFHSLAMPSTLSLADFPQADLSVVDRSRPPGATTLYQGTIDILNTVPPVPEPSTLCTLVIASVGLAVRRHRKRNP